MMKKKTMRKRHFDPPKRGRSNFLFLDFLLAGAPYLINLSCHV